MKKQLGAGEFKAKCLGLLDEVQKHRTEIVITKYGKPVAKLVPIEEVPQSIFGNMKGSVVFMDDIVSPIDAEWDANKVSGATDDPAGYSLLDLDPNRRDR
jgi:prevent-host-death family protein